MGRVTGAQGVQGGAVGAAGALSTAIPGCRGEVTDIGWVLGRDQKSGTSSGTWWHLWHGTRHLVGTWHLRKKNE